MSELPAAQPLPWLDSIVDRRTALVRWSRGQRIVHFGCVDEPLLAERIRNGQLLHAALATDAASVVGVDISREGLHELERLVPGTYICMDVQRIDPSALPHEVDLVLAPEIIEHLPNPGAFLQGLAAYIGAVGCDAIITTPNAYHLANVLRFLVRRREYVHPDHMVMFTPTTLDRIVEQAGLEVVERHVHAWLDDASGVARVKHIVTKGMLRFNPWLASGLVWRVRPRRADEHRPSQE